MRIKEIELTDVIDSLPEITKLDTVKDFIDFDCQIFICALGFEDRCLVIPEQLAITRGFNCHNAYICEYSTNMEDNDTNKSRLTSALEAFSDSVNSLRCDDNDYIFKLRELISNNCSYPKKPKIVFDISVASSNLLLSTIKVLLEFEIDLRVLYSEAEIYHPTVEEFNKSPSQWANDENLGLSVGVSQVYLHPEYSGSQKQNPDLIIAFPNYKAERTQAVISNIDETILTRPEKRIIWIIGDSHMEDKERTHRKQILKTINRIGTNSIIYEASTFDYKQTIEILEKIYKDMNLKFHIDISALGAKMQSLGIAIFDYIRPDISVYVALPRQYNSSQYSEGHKETWKIDFGSLKEIKSALNKIGQIELLKD
jgi:hypothetical protein